MISFVALLENWGINQDYGWFLAAIFWAIVAAGFYSRKHWGDAMPWLVAFALANLAMPVLEMVHFFSGLSDDQQILDRLFLEDLAIGMTPALTLVFLGMAGLSTRRGTWLSHRANRLVLLGLGLVATEMFGIWRSGSPVFAGTLLGLGGLAMAWWLVGRRIFSHPEIGPYWKVGLGLWCALLWGGTTGPLAYLLNEGRGLYQFTHFAAPAQAISLGAAAAFAGAIWRLRLNAGLAKAAWPETRQALWALVAWLAFGFLFVEWSGRWSRTDYETNLLRRARLVAAYLDKDALDAALGPKFQIGKIGTRVRTTLGTRATSTMTYSRVPYAFSPAFDRLREQLKPAWRANNDFWDLSLINLRQGWMAVAIKWPDYHDFFSEIILMRAGEELDRIRLAGSDGIVLGPTLEPWGYIVHAWVPVHGRNDQMVLGWLDVEIFASNWAIEFNRARLQAMGVLLVGVLLWATAVGLRQRSIRQSEAESLAAVAVAADQAKSRFLTHVSHELRTPLQGMLGFAELMATGPLEAVQRQRLVAVLSQGVVLKRLVNDLIDLGAIQAGAFRLQPTVFDPIKLAQECVESVCAGAVAKNLEVRLRYNASLTSTCLVRADAVRLRQMLLNLLGNAVKFTAAGEVSLDFATEAVTSSPLAVRLQMVVRDNGPGIPVALRAQLFKPFGTLGLQPAEGAGLGLAITAAIANEMGGKLVLLDEGPPGAAFQLNLNCERAIMPDAEAGRTAQVPWGRLKLLVADDNLLVRTWLVEVFTVRGAAVQAVANGVEALEVCAEREFDVVILDISMPGLDGWEVARRLVGSSDTPRRPRLLGLSAHASASDHQRAKEAGFDAFLTKPVAMADLAAVFAGFRLGAADDDEVGPATGAADLMQRLEALYWSELPGALERLRAAHESADRRELASAAHYLKNSADITRRVEVARLCLQLEMEVDLLTTEELDTLVARLVSVCATGPRPGRPETQAVAT